MRHSAEKPRRLLPILVTSAIVGAIACTDLMSGPDHDSHNFSRDLRAQATISAILTGSIELNTAAGRYYSPTSRASARLTMSGGRSPEIATSSLSAPSPSNSGAPGLVVAPNIMSQSTSRAVASDTTVAIRRTINGKKHRVFLTTVNRTQDQQKTRPFRVIRLIDDKLVDAMELVETRVGDRWVVTKGRMTFFDSTGRDVKGHRSVRIE